MDTNLEVINALDQKTPKDRIKFRIGFKNRSKTKAAMLAYVDARYVMDQLDAAVGKDKWSASYSVTGETMFCTIKVTWPDGSITEKTDCGMVTEVDAEKGQASDAFKRAAVHYGIGRDLYSLGQFWADLDDGGYVERDWKPVGWGSSTGQTSTTTQQPTPESQPTHQEPEELDTVTKANKIIDKLEQQAPKALDSPQDSPDAVGKADLSSSNLKVGTPPEAEYVEVNNLNKVAESAKAVLLLPPEFKGDPKDGELTRKYWVPKQYLQIGDANMNGKYNVSIIRWQADEKGYKIEDGLPF